MWKFNLYSAVENVINDIETIRESETQPSSSVVSFGNISRESKCPHKKKWVELNSEEKKMTKCLWFGQAWVLYETVLYLA